MSRGPIPDKPANRPTVAELQPLIDAYYQFDGCGVGGDLHVVLDDGNWEDHSIRWCIDHAGEYGKREPECARLLGRLLLLTTMTQRHKLSSGYGGAPMAREAFLTTASALLGRCGYDHAAVLPAAGRETPPDSASSDPSAGEPDRSSEDIPR